MEDKKSDLPDYCRKLTIRDANGMLKELIFPKSLDLDRPKRARTTFSSEQLNHLERIFLKNQYLVGRERSDLAKILNLSETQVKVWFQNRRTKHKRDQIKQSDDEKSDTPESLVCNAGIPTRNSQSPSITTYSATNNSVPFGLLSQQTESAPFSVDYLMQSPSNMMNSSTSVTPTYSMPAYPSSTAAAFAASLCFSRNSCPPSQYSCMIGSQPSSMFDLQQQLMSHFTHGAR